MASGYSIGQHNSNEKSNSQASESNSSPDPIIDLLCVFRGGALLLWAMISSTLLRGSNLMITKISLSVSICYFYDSHLGIVILTW